MCVCIAKPAIRHRRHHSPAYPTYITCVRVCVCVYLYTLSRRPTNISYTYTLYTRGVHYTRVDLCVRNCVVN